MHIVDAAEQLWVQQRLESARRPSFDAKQKQAILERLIAAEGLRNTYTGVIRVPNALASKGLKV